LEEHEQLHIGQTTLSDQFLDRAEAVYLPLTIIGCGKIVEHLGASS
jgi:hypothetical protein